MNETVAFLQRPDFWQAFYHPKEQNFDPDLLAILEPHTNLIREHFSYDHPETGETVDSEWEFVRLNFPVVNGFSLIWESSGFGEEELYLSGETSDKIGWCDAHCHPYCLRSDEFEKIIESIDRNPEWAGSSAPFLFLAPYVGLENEDQADAILLAARERLEAMGFEDLRRQKDRSFEDIYGYISHGLCSELISFSVTVQTGSSWIYDGQDWSFVAHKKIAFSSNDVTLPVPCYSMRARDPYINFPNMDSGMDETFPFESFRIFRQELGLTDSTLE